jgi:hypothetical protein
MKLNLLPTYVSKEKQSKAAWVISILIVLVAVAASLIMITTSNKALADAKAEADAIKPKADEAVAIANQADVIIAKAAPIITNTNLAQTMLKHNTVYPDLYDTIRPYVPSFFRVTTMAATPNGPDSTTVALTGVLKSYQQYADLMVALLRIPDAATVSRTGFQNIDPIIPAITAADQVGRPHRPGEAPIPDDPLQRLAQKQASGSVQGFSNQGNFGSPDHTISRGAMPGYSLVTVSVVIRKNIQTPVPKSTLATIKAGSPAASSSAATNAALPGAPPLSTPPSSTPPADSSPATPKSGRKNPASGAGEGD